MKYVRQEDNYTSSDYFTTGTTYVFPILSAGTYHFYFYSVCGENASDGFIVIDDIIGT